MARRNGRVKAVSRREAAACVGHEAEIESLRRRIEELEDERDQARQGVEMLTVALRRQGCCEEHA